MPNYLSPGVYVEEVEAGSRPIEGVGTAVAAFVGLAAQGPFNTPTLVTNWSQFTATFGDFMERGLDGRKPTFADWKNHLNTIWPEVRLRGFLEPHSH